MTENIFLIIFHSNSLFHILFKKMLNAFLDVWDERTPCGKKRKEIKSQPLQTTEIFLDFKDKYFKISK